jgi:hypothetical protein
MTEAHPAQSTGGASCDDEGATVIRDAGHYLLADNPEAVGDAYSPRVTSYLPKAKDRSETLCCGAPSATDAALEP